MKELGRSAPAATYSLEKKFMEFTMSEIEICHTFCTGKASLFDEKSLMKTKRSEMN